MGGVADAVFYSSRDGAKPAGTSEWIPLLQDRPKDKPFFLWYASRDAHRGWTINDEAPTYPLEDIIIPPYLVDGPATRDDLASYYHEVSRFDTHIGNVVAELKRQGVFENTVIIVMADNGRPFPRAKTRLYDSGIKTPFVIHYPKAYAPGTTNSLISSIDVSATVLDLAGIEKSERIQGVSLKPILEDHNAVVRDLTFAEHNWHVFRNHERMVRTGDWLYIKNNIPDQQNLSMEAMGGGSGKELWEGHRNGTLTDAQKNIFWNPCPEEELYHVGKDPEQLSNLATNPENETILKKMRAHLLAWTEQTGDTLPEIDALTPDRNHRPGTPKPEGKPSRKVNYGEMPGDTTNAQQNNHPGPQKL